MSYVEGVYTYTPLCLYAAACSTLLVYLSTASRVCFPLVFLINFVGVALVNNYIHSRCTT